MGKQKTTKLKHEISWTIVFIILFIIGIIINFGYRYYCQIMEQRHEEAINNYTWILMILNI